MGDRAAARAWQDKRIEGSFEDYTHPQQLPIWEEEGQTGLRGQLTPGSEGVSNHELCLLLAASALSLGYRAV